MTTTDTPRIDAMTMQLARFEVPKTPHARSYCRDPQADRIKELEYALIAVKEPEAVWKTERDKADQRRLEAEAEVERLREALDTLTLVVGLTPIAGNKEALQEAFNLARKALNPTNK